MSSFMGGSAYAMAHQLAEGFILLTAASLRKFNPGELRLLETELDKLAREIRAENPAGDDTQAIQKKNRKLSRINQAGLIIRGHFERKH
jgi:hypothetical protein